MGVLSVTNCMSTALWLVSNRSKPSSVVQRGSAPELEAAADVIVEFMIDVSWSTFDIGAHVSEVMWSRESCLFCILLYAQGLT